MQRAGGLNVTTWGTGDPAVLVHGSFGRGEATWKEQRPLADAYRLQLVDRRGFGVRGNWEDSPPREREVGRAALHAVCDVLERELDAESATLADAHNPQLLGAPFNERLRSFWESS